MTRASGSTTYLYPQVDIDRALHSTQYKYTTDGTNIICPTQSDLLGVYNDIYTQTTLSQPDGNVGYSCNNGTLLEDMGKDLQFLLNSAIIIKWRLTKQITPQNILPTPGNSPNGTIGYVTVFSSYGIRAWLDTGNILDVPSVIRIR